MRMPLSTLARVSSLMLLLCGAPVLGHPSFYSNNCTSCHSATTTTCAGCHSHGTHSNDNKNDINVRGTTNKSSYAPGETITVTINGGYRSGWVRTLLLDQNMAELKRSSCPGGTGGCTTAGYPATLTASAPSTPGTYVWAVAWYGNKYDDTGASFGSGTSATLKAGYFTPDNGNSNHGFQVVALPAFTVVAAAAPAIAVNPTSLSFGTVTVGTPKTLSIQVQNSGNAALNVTSVALCSGTTTRFSVSPSSLTVAAGQSGTVNVTYTPTGSASDSGCISLTHNATNQASPLSVNVSATGASAPAPSIAVNPTSLSFGTVTVGTPKTLSIQVQNGGTAALNVTSVALCSGTSTRFSVSPTSVTVPAGQSGTVNVTYTPTGAATDSGCIALTHNATNQASPLNVNVSATGTSAPAPSIAVNPTSLSFGTVTVGTPKTLSVQVQNNGTATLNVTSVALCSGTTSRFSVSPGSLTVAAGQSGTVNVTYTPTGAAADSGCVALTHNATNQASPLNVNVTATGTSAPAASIAVNPTSLSFGTVTVGTPKTLSIQVQNTGTATLNVTSIALCSGTTTRFSVSPGSLMVAAGQSGTVNVTYTPTGAGMDSGCIALTNNATNQASPLKVNLSATGSLAPAPSIAVNPTSLSFGTVRVGMPRTLSVQVQNTGTATLNVTSVARCGGTTTRFSVSPASLTVAAGQSGTVNVTYTPTGAATDSGCIALTHNATNQTSPLNVNLSATGSLAPAPSVDVSPTSLSFGTVMVGDTTTLDLRVENPGTASLSVSSITLCSGTTTRFSVSPTSLSIAAGQSGTVHVTYTPTGTAPDSGCIALTHNATNQASPLNVDVSGTGSSVATPSIVLSPTGLSFGTVKTGTPKTMTVQVENTGAAALTVSSVALCSGTPAVVTWTPAAPLTVSAGGTASLDVTYAPTDTAPLPPGACLTLTSNDPSKPTLTLPVEGATSSGPPPDIIGGCSSLPSGGSGTGIVLGFLLAAGALRRRQRQRSRARRSERGGSPSPR